jgi:hypothetical protein
MSAVRRQQQYVLDDDFPTQAVSGGAVRAAATAPLRAVPRGAAAPRGGRQAYAAGRAAVETRPSPLAAFDPSRLISTVVIVAALAIVLYFGITSLLAWTQVKLDDLHYGRPRTSQLDAFVGHGEANGTPSHFVAMNLSRRVTVIEFPGGDVTKPQVIVGPYLFGRAEDLTVVKLRVEDINNDGKADLTVQVKDERLVYINDGAAFRPITAEELAQLKQQEGGH